jgi:hypothetical protein
MVSAIRRCFGGAPPLLTQAHQEENPLKEWRRRALPSRKETERKALLSWGDYDLYYPDTYRIPNKKLRFQRQISYVVWYVFEWIFLTLRLKKSTETAFKEFAKCYAEVVYAWHDDRYRRAIPSDTKFEAYRTKRGQISKRLLGRYKKSKLLAGNRVIVAFEKIYQRSSAADAPLAQQTQDRLMQGFSRVFLATIREAYVQQVKKCTGSNSKIEKFMLDDEEMEEVLDEMTGMMHMRLAKKLVVYPLSRVLVKGEYPPSCKWGCSGCASYKELIANWDQLVLVGELSTEDETRRDQNLGANLRKRRLYFRYPHYLVGKFRNFKKPEEVASGALAYRVYKIVARSLKNTYETQREFESVLTPKMSENRRQHLQKLVQRQNSASTLRQKWLNAFFWNENYEAYLQRIAPGGVACLQHVQAYIDSGCRGEMEWSEGAEQELREQALKEARYMLGSKAFAMLLADFVSPKKPALEVEKVSTVCANSAN